MSHGTATTYSSTIAVDKDVCVTKLECGCFFFFLLLLFFFLVIVAVVVDDAVCYCYCIITANTIIQSLTAFVPYGVPVTAVVVVVVVVVLSSPSLTIRSIGSYSNKVTVHIVRFFFILIRDLHFEFLQNLCVCEGSVIINCTHHP